MNIGVVCASVATVFAVVKGGGAGEPAAVVFRSRGKGGTLSVCSSRGRREVGEEGRGA